MFRRGIEMRRRLENLILAGLPCLCGALEQSFDLSTGHGMERFRRLEGLVQHLLLVDSGDHDRSRKVQRIMQALDWFYLRSTFQDNAVRTAKGLHGQDADIFAGRTRHDFSRKAPEMSVHN